MFLSAPAQDDPIFDELSTPKRVANYLLAVKPVIAGAADTRRAFIRELGRLLLQVKLGDAQSLAGTTGELGTEGRETFRDAGLALERMHAPPLCLECQDAARGWVQMHVLACEVMIEVGKSGNLKGLRE